MIRPDPDFEGGGTAAVRAPEVMLRQPPTYIGGSCQLGFRNDGNPPGARNASTATVVDNFHPTQDAQPTKLSWSGHFRSGGGSTGSPFRDATQAQLSAITTEPFTVTIYNDNPSRPGVPQSGSIVFQQSFSNVSRVADTTTNTSPAVGIVNGAISLAGYPGQAQNQWPAFQVYDYEVVLTNCPTLLSSKCYWLGIRQTGSLPTGLGWRWMNAFPGAGDSYCYQKFDTEPDFSFWSQLNGLDCCFCLDIPFDTAGCPANPAPAACPFARLDGGAGNDHCQAPGLADIGLVVIASNIARGGFNEVLSCDDFTVNGPITLTGLCFTGAYSGLSVTTRPAPDEALSIRVFRNNTGAYGFPDTGQQVGPTVFVKPVSIDPDRNSTNPLSATPGATVTVNKSFLPFGGVFDYTVDLSGISGGGIALPQAGCYWIAIEGQSSAATWQYVLRQFHGTPSPTGGDGYLCAATDAVFSAARITFGYDAGLCLSFALNANTCPAVPLAGNGSCATAQSLSIPTAPFVGSTLNTGNDGAVLPPAFGSVTATTFSPGLFYTLTPSSDRAITVSTCLSGQSPPNGEPDFTSFNTLLTVYCGGCGGLKAIADNDDAPYYECGLNSPDSSLNYGASTLRFPGKAGTPYTLYLTGANGNTVAEGFFWLSVAGTAASPADPPATCGSVIDPPCPLNVPAPPGANDILEAAFCTSVSNDNNDNPCASAPNDMRQISAGQTAWGTVYTDTAANVRDTDWWQLLPDAPGFPNSDGGTEAVYRLTMTSEAPLAVTVFVASCPLDPNLVGTFLVVPACYPTSLDLVAFDPGHVYLRIQPTTRSGLACGTRNKYKFTLSAIPGAEFGACCVPPSGPVTCFLSTRAACTASQTFPGAYPIAGVFAGGTCSPNPCDVTYGVTSAPFGACCQPDGTCTMTTQPACPTGGGGTWTVHTFNPPSDPPDATVVCAPPPCALNVHRCCLADGTCRLATDTLCGSLGGTGSPGTCVPIVCAPAGACCRIGACTIETAAQCAGSGSGVFQGNSTVCSPNPCSPPCPVVFTQQPVGTTICGDTGTVSLTAAWAGTAITQRWRRNGVFLSNGGHFSGVFTPSLLISPATAADAGSYDISVSDACGGATSLPAPVSVGSVAVVTLQPALQAICAGSPTIITALVSGATPTSFQWYFSPTINGTPAAVPNANLNTLTIQSATPFDAGYYTCRVGTGSCFSTSDQAALTVSLPVTNRYFVGPTGGGWNAPSNWSASAGGAGGAGVPVAGQSAFLTGSTTKNILFNANYQPASQGIDCLTIEGSGAAKVTLLHSTNGAMLVQGNESIGVAGPGAYTQSGASSTNTARGTVYIGPGGTYTLQGGTLTAAAIFNNGTLHIGNTSTLLRGALLDPPPIATINVSGQIIGSGAVFSGAATITGGTIAAPIAIDADTTLTKTTNSTLVISAPQTYGQGASFDAQQGSTVFTSPMGAAPGDANLTLLFHSSGTPTDVQIALDGAPGSRIAYIAGAQIMTPGEIDLKVGAGEVLVSHALDLDVNSGAYFDIGTNTFILDHADNDHGAGQTDKVASYARSGRSGGTWTGTGILSRHAGQIVNSNAAVAVLNNDNGSGQPIYPTFHGVNTDASSVLVQYTLYGDSNLDGAVDTADLTRWILGLQGAALRTGSPSNPWYNGDFNYDGTVDMTDLSLLSAAYASTHNNNMTALLNAIAASNLSSTQKTQASNAICAARGCIADFNNNCQASVQDIFDFLSAWFAHSPTADINHSGTVSVQDIFDFLSLWFAKCQ